jgi:hypothetical protein
MERYLIGAAILIVVLGAGDLIYDWYNVPETNDFISCYEAGGSIIMESYPEQCRTRDGRVFINEKQGQNIPEVDIEGSTLSYVEALQIAQNSDCLNDGFLLDTYSYNGVTKTWWIDLEVRDRSLAERCSPACVVDEDTLTAEVNWRCTGLIPE